MFDEGSSADQFKDIPNISKTYQTAVANIGNSSLVCLTDVWYVLKLICRTTFVKHRSNCSYKYVV